MKTKWLAAVSMVIAIGIVGALLASRRPLPEMATVQPVPEHPAVAPLSQAPRVAPLEEIPARSVEPLKERSVPIPPKPQKPSPALTLSQTPTQTKEPLHDPAARDALALVGVDPDAEAYWADAIFDASLPDKERDDLMEDLNEVGFSDPDNPTVDDLPLIVNRLQIIQEVLPYADPFMTRHLLEAHKDLANMYALVAQQ